MPGMDRSVASSMGNVPVGMTWYMHIKIESKCDGDVE